MRGGPAKSLDARVLRSNRVCTSSGKARADEQRAVAPPQSVKRYVAEEHAGTVGENTCKSANKNQIKCNPPDEGNTLGQV
jgi:hypothetical protein